MMSNEDFSAITNRLLAHARNLAELDESWQALTIAFDNAVAETAADHAIGRLSEALARVGQLDEALDTVNGQVLLELEQLAATLSDVTGQSRQRAR